MSMFNIYAYINEAIRRGLYVFEYETRRGVFRYVGHTWSERKILTNSYDVPQLDKHNDTIFRYSKTPFDPKNPDHFAAMAGAWQF